MAHTPHYDHANLTIRLPEWPTSPTHVRHPKCRRRTGDQNMLNVPRRPDSSRSNSSRTITPPLRHSTHHTPLPQTSAATPYPTPTSLSGPPSLRNSPPFDGNRAPTSSVFHVASPEQRRRQYGHHLGDMPLQQPETPILSPSDDVIFPPSYRTTTSIAQRRAEATPYIGLNLGSDTPPVSPTPSPLVLSEDKGGDYFAALQNRATEITPPNDEELEISAGRKMSGSSTRGYFPPVRPVATCASTVAGTVAGNVSMQRWIRE